MPSCIYIYIYIYICVCVCVCVCVKFYAGFDSRGRDTLCSPLCFEEIENAELTSYKIYNLVTLKVIRLILRKVNLKINFRLKI